MDKRNKHWRRQQMSRVFKARMILYAAYGTPVIRDDGGIDNHPHWFELAKEKCAKVYQTTGTPCSCWMCRVKSITAGNIRGKLCALFESQWSRNRKPFFAYLSREWLYLILLSVLVINI